ncbi:DUF4830 domain-containing protein [Butyricicoccus sp. OF10-2]|nr:DUF4830 domain-containing protein [Butyricicoccus sp. OF10-2]
MVGGERTGRHTGGADTRHLDEVYEQYNAIQQAQGLDLTPYQANAPRCIPTR